MKYSNFFIELQSLTLSEVSDIPDFRDESIVANITEEEFLESRLAYRLNGKENYISTRKKPENGKRLRTKFFVPTTKRNATYTPKPKKPKISRISQTSIKKPKAKPCMFTSTPIINKSQQPAEIRAVHFDKKFEVQKQKRAVSKPSLLPRLLPNIKPKTDNLLDLIPVDADCLGLEMDKLTLTSPELHESEYDTISCSSSDSEYHSIHELFDCTAPQNNSPPNKQIPDIGRPGVKLDIASIRPPTKDIVSKLPVAEIYKCDRPGCGFTTSNSTNRKLHSCTRWTIEDSAANSEWSTSSS